MKQIINIENPKKKGAKLKSCINIHINDKKRNKTQKIYIDNIANNKYNMILIIIMLALVQQNITESISPNYPYITLRINKKGNMTIYNNNKCGNDAPLPSEIYINGIKQSTIQSFYDLKAEDNNITLIWNNSINTAQCMFYQCKYITEMNFSNFESSLLTNMY